MQSLMAMSHFEDFLNGIQCTWLSSILQAPSLTDDQKYLAITERAKRI
ncbi:hypothetical protein [Agaribacterium sp. ZY112]